uniref:Uncharacterized protein n=1 Tax=Ciona savignyi TaxID=51511 RepID=H2ZA67_CIOSA
MFMGPPKIKPRKTVPKRRAPVAPKKPPTKSPDSPSKSKPLIAVRSEPKLAPSLPQNGPSKGHSANSLLLDDPFSCYPSAMPAPLLPFNQTPNSDSTPSVFGDSQFDPFSSTSNHVTPSMPNQDIFSVFGNHQTPATDPWAAPSNGITPPTKYLRLSAPIFQNST